MSISYRAEVIYGFKLDIETVTKQEKRFNEKTGEPYLIDEPSHEIGLVGSTQVISTENDPDCLCQGEETDGMEIFEAGYDDGQKFLGTSFAEVGKYRENTDYALLPKDDAKLKAADAFAEKFNLDPQLYLVMSCG